MRCQMTPPPNRTTPNSWRETDSSLHKEGDYITFGKGLNGENLTRVKEIFF